MLLDSLLYELCDKLASNPEPLTRKLALIEHGVANYCRKMAGELDPNLIPLDPNHTHKSDNPLAWYLFEQYIEERLHGQMLGSLIKDSEIAHRRYAGGFVGKERVEGLSNIEVFWWLFLGKRAEDLTLGDRLAMMSVLESYSEKFYSCLAHTLPDSPLQRIAEKIAFEERSHKNGLHYHLIQLVGKVKANWLMLKWKIKVLFVLPIAIRLGLEFAGES